MALTLLTGGMRSGKSRLAVRLAAASGADVVVLATAEPRDDDMAARITRHRDERPDGWGTVEEPVELTEALAATPADTTVVVDCLTLWVSNLVDRGHDDGEILDRAIRAARLAAGREGTTVVVTNEVGGGVIPVNPLARRYADLLGRVNAAWAEPAHRAYLVVAGRVLPLQPAGTVEP
ncbi:MAG: bifunctional adenosylcobinamide kinase/adenosylcobinamide-phosphate guanylyltransferase [Streptosporangiales bacterium]|nr:bifunctional adenosylcobinamide kinase/adenosylcobinamide-phosphate guanylyltransferase [Streptosporangiales bacterium]MBO0891544.1 bifunctional adenosylcobinamide kinase/adenosylcobinamide-phosphate guanylyltransferase [Acidothermales bacterium]